MFDVAEKQVLYNAYFTVPENELNLDSVVNKLAYACFLKEAQDSLFINALYVPNIDYTKCLLDNYICNTRPYIHYEINKSSKSNSIYIRLYYQKETVLVRISDHIHPNKQYKNKPYYDTKGWTAKNKKIIKFIEASIKYMYKQALNHLGAMEVCND